MAPVRPRITARGSRCRAALPQARSSACGMSRALICAHLTLTRRRTRTASLTIILSLMRVQRRGRLGAVSTSGARHAGRSGLDLKNRTNFPTL